MLEDESRPMLSPQQELAADEGGMGTAREGHVDHVSQHHSGQCLRR